MIMNMNECKEFIMSCLDKHYNSMDDIDENMVKIEKNSKSYFKKVLIENYNYEQE